jgi:flavin reductase (DIM6/NTAB) family NADH-FMN oxidoreductase RutF
MKKIYKKKDFPADKIRKYLEPGPIVLVSSGWKDRTNIMTMGWHTVLEFSPSLIGCLISEINFSHELIAGSGECVINIPTADLLDEVIGIGNSSGKEIDKFVKFNLTPEPGTMVKAPMIKECFANYECIIKDDHLVPTYNFFIFEVVKAHVATRPEYPKTVHYCGDGVFMISGKHVAFPEKFRPEYL